LQMIAFSSPDHSLHAPQDEFYRGQRVPCFETPSRAGHVRTQLLARGHSLRAPGIDSSAVLVQVHTERYLGFLQTACHWWLAPARLVTMRGPILWGLLFSNNAAIAAQALVVSLGLDTFAGDPISKFSLQSDDFLQLGQRIAKLRLPTIFVLEGGYAAAELGVNAVNVIEGFEQALSRQFFGNNVMEQMHG
jgi:acetoin utilization deacetylase AcuC-like enzyme